MLFLFCFHSYTKLRLKIGNIQLMGLFTYLIACFTALKDWTKITFEYGKFQDSPDALKVIPLCLGFRWNKGCFSFRGETGNMKYLKKL